jgi:hypothetical protein
MFFNTGHVATQQTMVLLNYKKQLAFSLMKHLSGLLMLLSILLACAARYEIPARETPPVREDPVVKEIAGIASHINAFYSRQQYTPDSLRMFASCAQEYADIQADLQALVTRDSAAQNALDQWQQYQNEHKGSNTCNKDSLAVRSRNMEHLLKAITDGRKADKN